MVFHGLDIDSDACGDLYIATPHHHEIEDLALAPRQAGQARGYGALLGTLESQVPIALQRVAHRPEHGGVTQGKRQDVHGTRLL